MGHFSAIEKTQILQPISSHSLASCYNARIYETNPKEQENPGCFDNPDHTFVDLYMKSGLYITEIVKRLYRSEKIKKLFPNNEERLNHIFEKQVYGLAPTEIIYRIAISFILGFSDEINIKHNNLRHFDTLPYAQDGTLESKLDEVFNDKGNH